MPSLNIIRMIKWRRRTGTFDAHAQDDRYVGKHAERPPGIPRRRWENGIKLSCKETGYGSLDWVYLAHDSQLSSLGEHGGCSLGFISGGDSLSSCATASFSVS